MKEIKQKKAKSQKKKKNKHFFSSLGKKNKHNCLNGGIKYDNYSTTCQMK